MNPVVPIVLVILLMVITTFFIYKKSNFQNIYQVNELCPYNETNGINVVRGASGKLPFSTISNKPSINYQLLKKMVN
jgi:hypothetical protein